MRKLRRIAFQWIAPVTVGVLAVAGVGNWMGGSDPPLKMNSGLAPWPLPDRAGDRIRAAGLPPYKETGPSDHPHAHLDIFVDGRPVPIPAGLGLVRPYSPLHTHSESGFLHMESADEDAVFTLHQAFTLWGVRLDASCVGAYCAPDKPAQIYVNGQRRKQPIHEARLVPYTQIALVIGTPPPSIPAFYDCHDAADIERRSCEDFMARFRSRSENPEPAPGRTDPRSP